MRGNVAVGVAALCVSTAIPGLARAGQPAPVPPGAVRCADDCVSTGQRSAPPVYDESHVQVVSKWVPLTFQGQAPVTRLIARVLVVSPLLLEVFDSRYEELLDSKPLPAPGELIASEHCGVWRFDAITAASSEVWRTLQFNDLVTATVVHALDESKPDLPLAERRILSDLQKRVTPVPFFHSIGEKVCNNRSGMLATYRDRYNDQVTIYNDGGIHYTNGLYREFNQERLTPAELSSLLALFGQARFDDVPSSLPVEREADKSTLTLISSRYQHVSVADNESRLAAVVHRMEECAERATVRTSFVLRVGRKMPLTVLPWSYPQIPLSDYVAFRSRGYRQRDAADGPVPAEFAPLWQPLPESLLALLPVKDVLSAVKDSDPNRWVYFASHGRLYRVTRSLDCEQKTPPSRAADVLGVMEIYPPKFEGDPLSPWTPILVDSPWMWPHGMGLRLADVMGRKIITKSEFKANKPIYFMMLSLRAAKPRIIEDGVEYPDVRFCQVESDDIDTCELR